MCEFVRSDGIKQVCMKSFFSEKHVSMIGELYLLKYSKKKLFYEQVANICTILKGGAVLLYLTTEFSGKHRQKGILEREILYLWMLNKKYSLNSV